MKIVVRGKSVILRAADDQAYNLIASDFELLAENVFGELHDIAGQEGEYLPCDLSAEWVMSDSELNDHRFRSSRYSNYAVGVFDLPVEPHRFNPQLLQLFEADYPFDDWKAELKYDDVILSDRIVYDGEMYNSDTAMKNIEGEDIEYTWEYWNRRPRKRL